MLKKFNLLYVSNEFCKLYELCKFYEYFMSRLTYLEIAGNQLNCFKYNNFVF